MTAMMKTEILRNGLQKSIIQSMENIVELMIWTITLVWKLIMEDL